MCTISIWQKTKYQTCGLNSSPVSSQDFRKKLTFQWICTEPNSIFSAIFQMLAVRHVGRFATCAFSYKFGIRCMQELLLILTTNVYGCRSQTLFIKCIHNCILNAECISFYGHCGTTMAHMTWSWNRCSTNTLAPVGLVLGRPVNCHAFCMRLMHSATSRSHTEDDQSHALEAWWRYNFWSIVIGEPKLINIAHSIWNAQDYCKIYKYIPKNWFNSGGPRQCWES